MKDLLIYIAKCIAEFPDNVSVSEVEQEKEILLELRVAKDDVGKMIGRHGRVAKEIRTLMRTNERKIGKRITVKISE